MTPEEAIAYIENYGWSTTRLGLERTRELLRLLGNPQKHLKFIHVAGSNGKGSTCAMLDAILRAAGYKTGLYTSPYIESFCERIQVNGEPIPGDTLAELTDRIRLLADAMEDHPSQFELVTALAMEYFRQEACDIVVLEVGMGGALDSTNAIDAPELAVITNIGLEHTEYLGNTLEEIATTKAGIIKTGCTAVAYDGSRSVKAVLNRICAERQVPLTIADNRQLTPLESDWHGQHIQWKTQDYTLRLLGRYQLRNAALVFTCVDALRHRGWKIPEAALQEGLRKVHWPARMELLGESPVFLLDGGHNPQCAEALAEALRELRPGARFTFLMGVLADKDYESMLQTVLPLAEQFVCLTPDSPRALSAEALAGRLRELGCKAQTADTASEGVSEAVRLAGELGSVVAFGSLYMAGAIRQAYISMS